MLKLTASYELPYGVRMGGFLNTRTGFPRNDRFPATRWDGNRYSTIYFDCYKQGKSITTPTTVST